jgi:hypothetical protein
MTTNKKLSQLILIITLTLLPFSPTKSFSQPFFTNGGIFIPQNIPTIAYAGTSRPLTQVTDPAPLVAQNFSQSSVVSLKEYFTTLLNERCRIIDQRFAEQDRALQLSRDELERRLEGLNQLRQDVVKDRSEYVTRDVYELNHKVLESRINSVEDAIAQMETRTATIIALMGFVIIAINLLLQYATYKRRPK